MTSAEVCWHSGISSQRKETCCRADAILLHDHGAVMQRRARPEYRKQQVSGDLRVQPHAAFHKCPQADIPFEHDEGSRLLLRKSAQGQQDLVDRLRTLEPPAQPPLASDARKSPPDFRLEQDDHSDGGVGYDVRHYTPLRLHSGSPLKLISDHDG